MKRMLGFLIFVLLLINAAVVSAGGVITGYDFLYRVMAALHETQRGDLADIMYEPLNPAGESYCAFQVNGESTVAWLNPASGEAFALTQWVNKSEVSNTQAITLGAFIAPTDSIIQYGSGALDFLADLGRDRLTALLADYTGSGTNEFDDGNFTYRLSPVENDFEEDEEEDSIDSPSPVDENRLVLNVEVKQ